MKRDDAMALARALGWTRVAIGAACLLAPRLTGRLFTGRPVTEWSGVMGLRQVGGREIGVGLGLLRALNNGEGVRAWLLVSAASDASDCAAVLGAWRDMAPLQRIGFLAAAAGGTALGVTLASELD